MNEQSKNIIFNQLKTNLMMNYLAMVPNLYCVSPLQTPYYHSLAPQNEIKPFPNVFLLNTISQALNTSLRNYQQQLTKNSNATQAGLSQTLLPKEKPQDLEKTIEIIIPQKEEGENLKAKFNQPTNKATPKSPLSAEKVNTNSIQLPTDDENILESKDISKTKEHDLKKKNRKIRCENKTNSFQVIVPEVDLIDTAYLPQRAVNSESLAKKREQLMNRRVGDWKDFVKCKKQRRQIRMLGN